MKLGIHLLALDLFSGFPICLDLDTGKSYNMYLQADEVEKLRNKYRLPHYSEIPIYQRYLEMARNRLGIEFGSWFDQYPKIEFIPDYEPKWIREFIDEAHIAVDTFSDPSIPPFHEYITAFELQFAKDWCEENGFEWYDNWVKKVNPSVPLNF